MKCPFCSAWLENGLSRALAGVQTTPPMTVTNVDYIVEVGNRITAVIEEKHSAHHVAKTHQLITLKRIASRFGAPLFVTFIDDAMDNVVVYRVPPGVRFPRRYLYSFEDHTPVFMGDFGAFRSWLIRDVLRSVYPSLKIVRR